MRRNADLKKTSRFFITELLNCSMQGRLELAVRFPSAVRNSTFTFKYRKKIDDDDHYDFGDDNGQKIYFGDNDGNDCDGDNDQDE